MTAPLSRPVVRERRTETPLKAKTVRSPVSASSETTSDRRKPAAPPPGVLVYTIPQFCYVAQISQATYFRLKQQNKTPAETKIGGRTVIRVETAAEWLKAMECNQAE
jgi:predicted DNA-binding transcriptional regulator AlpA